jgi:LacI family transcriptional regulator
MKTRITITDVAKRAGVHYTTVSMALRNHPRLPLATRERLRALAQEMGYRPDPMLHALIDYRTQRTPERRMTTLAFVTNGVTRSSWKQDRHYSAMLDGAANRASELGYQFEHFWLGEPGLTHRRLSEVLHSRGIVGVLIAPQRHEADMSLLFDWSKFSAVGIDWSSHQPSLHNVAVDRCAAVRVAMRRARAAGYRRIGFAMHYGWDLNTDLAWSSTFIAEQQRIAPLDRVPLFPFDDALALHGLDISPDHLSPDDGFDAWLRRFRPDVLISSHGLVGPQLEKMGISIPRDLALIDILAEDSAGKVAGIRHNYRRVGEVAVEILTRQMHQHTFGVPEVPTTTLVEGAWIDGESLPPSLTGAPVSEARPIVSEII